MAIRNLNNEELRFVIRSLNDTSWDKDHRIRELAKQCDMPNTTIGIFGLAPWLAMEMEIRTRK